MAELAATLDVPVLAVAGEVYDGAGDRIRAVSLTARAGAERSRAEAGALVEEVVAEHLASLG